MAIRHSVEYLNRRDQAQQCLQRARASLGSDLGGYSAVDLLADNFEWPLYEIRQMVEEIDRLNVFPLRPIGRNDPDGVARCTGAAPLLGGEGRPRI